MKGNRKSTKRKYGKRHKEKVEKRMQQNTTKFWLIFCFSFNNKYKKKSNVVI